MNRIFTTAQKHPTACAFLICIFVLVAFYAKVIFAGNVFVFVDASRFFYPLWKWGSVVLQQGIIPLWNPDAQLGTPYLADPQMACAYPPVFLFYSWLNPINAFTALILFHHLWAVAGFWVWVRTQGFSWKTSLWGCLAFGFSLHLVCSSWTPVAMMTISWLPWIFFSAERVYQKQNGGFLFLSLSWAMQLSAGYPVLTYLTGLALLGHLGWKSLRKMNREEGVSLVWLGWVGLAALAAAAYNLVWGLPFLEFLKNSNYQGGTKKVQDLGWENLGTFFNPFNSGDPLAGDYHGPHYWVATYFVGLPTLCLFVWGLVNRVYRKNTPWLLLLFLSLSLGSAIKLGDWLKEILPGYALVVHSGFWISLVILWAILLSMEALEIFIGQGLKKESNVSWIAVVIAVYAAALWLKNPYISMIFWVSGGLALSALWVKNLNLKWVMVLTALGLSLGPAAYRLNMTLDRSYYEKQPLVLSQLTQPGRFFFSPVLLGNAVRLQGQNMSDAYEGAKQNLFPNWPLTYGREEVPIYNTLQLNDSFDWTYLVFRQSLDESRKALDYLGVRYIFGPSHFKDLKEMPLTYEGVKVYENLSPFPRWFTVSKAVAASSPTVEDLIKADKEHMNYANEAFIENPAQEGNYQKRQVSEISRSLNSVRLSVRGKGRALLVSSETDSPGWKASVNGGYRLVEKINHAFRGVVLNDGEETVTFKYEPLTFRLGLFFTMLICGLWAGFLGYGFKLYLSAMLTNRVK